MTGRVRAKKSFRSQTQAEQKKRARLISPGGPKPPPGAGKDTEGLAAGYWREDGCDLDGYGIEEKSARSFDSALT